MRKELLLLLISVLIHGMLIGQSKFEPCAYHISLQKRSGEGWENTDVPIFKEHDILRISITQSTEQISDCGTHYFSIFDIGSAKEEFTQLFGGEINQLDGNQKWKSANFKATRPFGDNVLLAVFSNRMIDPNSITKNDLIWLIQGNPPEILKNVQFESVEYRVIPGDGESIRGHDGSGFGWGSSQGPTPTHGRDDRNTNSDIPRGHDGSGFGQGNSQVPTPTHGRDDRNTYSDIPSGPLQSGIHPGKKQENVTDLLYTVYPLIFVTSPPMSSETESIPVVTTRTYTLRGTASAKDGIKNITVNGSPVNRISDDWWESEIDLSPGFNEFLIEAITEKGNASSKSVDLRYDNNIFSKPIPSTNYLVLVGINQYKYFPHLDSPIRDCDSLANVLLSKYSFDPDHVLFIYDSLATLLNIDNKFRELALKLKPTDNLIVYFAGHGIYDELTDEGFWIPYDAKNGTYTDYYPNSRILKYLKALKARHVVIFADACFSGSLILQDRGADNFDTNIEKFKSRWIFASGLLEKVEDRLAGSVNSPFAHYLIKYLNDNSDNTLSFSTISQRVKLAVANDGNQTPIVGAIKQSGDEGGEFVFKLRGRP